MMLVNKTKEPSQWLAAAISFIKKNAVLLAAVAILFPLFLSGGVVFRILAAYFLPIFYVHFRLKKLFIREAHRKAFTFFYILLIAAFPVMELLSHAIGRASTKYFLLISYESLPFLL